ncbi:signal peptidase II [Thermosediminibacter litoriperuensis]|uniref:Lipoprotein signal peptidase n=1 Tax=Thermosediminibacter litoriperuensis TaxID=291989 RepID=A0A5S5AZ71_9FIRM|nr:signal peptidase II [Thermosediminibacter litoriperuensis]TYP60011.1 signal peptidase II Aspartic peptidase MEROPS family A08 [Thermosediminibacter litoriperuensis]
MSAWILAAAVFIIDQFTKYIVRVGMVPHQSIPVIKDILYITYIQNTGAAFSILQGRVIFFTTVSLMVIAALIFYIFRIPPEKRFFRMVLSLILGGAAGNLADRLRFGYVVDFIDFRVWPVFNLADSAIVIGVALLAYIIIFDSHIMKSLE